MSDFPRPISIHGQKSSMRRVPKTTCNAEPVHVETTYLHGDTPSNFKLMEKDKMKMEMKSEEKITQHENLHDSEPSTHHKTKQDPKCKSSFGMNVILWFIILFIIVLIIIMGVFWFIQPAFCTKACADTGKDLFDLGTAMIYAFIITLILVVIFAMCWASM